MQEVKLLSVRREKLKGMIEDRIRLQNRATEKYYEHIFEEMKEMEEKKSVEALPFVQKKSIYEDFRTKEMQQEDCKDLESQEG